MIRRLVRFSARKILRDERGSAGVEFALIAPVFLMILAGTFEVGTMIQGKFDLISDVSAAAHHLLAIGTSIDAETAEPVATTIANLLAGTDRTATVNVNRAVTATLASGTLAVAETGADVGSCYCPSRSGDLVTWGSSMGCNAACGDGSGAGRFALITAEAPWAAIVFANGLFSDKTVHSTAMVRLP